MSRYSGKQGRGASKNQRERARIEAEIRNAKPIVDQEYIEKALDRIVEER